MALIAAATVPAVAAEAMVAEETACVAEVEPNDEIAQPITFSGERCISGTLVAEGDTDIFMWQVDEEEAASAWTLSIDGVPLAVTTVDLLRGDPTAGDRVARLEAKPGSAEAAAEVLLESGAYAIVVSRDVPTEDGELDGDLGYSLLIEASQAEGSEPPAMTSGSARIVVASGEIPAPGIGGAVAIEMLLDTSGSMLERLGKKTKIEVAERTLIDLVDRLPQGMPVAMRTFKAKPKSCATVLRVPLEPLRPKAMKRAIRELPMRKGTRTPIAKAIRQVPRDLRDAEGHRVVVLVTDGKENCGGDPAAAIATLVDAGTTATVHLIGYALPDDETLRETLAEWAVLGGGQYFDAPDRASLNAALRSATIAPYLVFDEEGMLVAQGLVGDEGVDVEAGVFTVEVLSDPPSTFEQVDLEVGDVEELTITAETEPAV